MSNQPSSPSSARQSIEAMERVAEAARSATPRVDAIRKLIAWASGAWSDPAAPPAEEPFGTCDCDCDEPSVAWRWWEDAGGWLVVCAAHAEDLGGGVLGSHPWNVTPLKRLQICPDEAVSPSPDAPQTEAESESRRPDSNRGPLHYESKQHDHPSPRTTTQSGSDEASDDPEDPARQRERLQNASSLSAPVLGAHGRLHGGAR